MLGHLSHVIHTPVSRAWMATSSRSWRTLPRPADTASAHAPGTDPHRILLVGGGIAVGWGVRTHELGLAGNLARQTSALTRRGVSVDLVVDPDLTPSTAAHALQDADLTRYDCVVLTLGGLEGLTRVPPSAWRRDLGRLIVLLAADRAERGIVAVGALGLSSTTRGDRALNRHIAKLNAITQELVEQAGGLYVRVQSDAIGEATDAIGRRAYATWARTIADAVVRTLPASAIEPPPVVWDEPRRQQAVDRLTGIAPDPELERIIATARDLFGVRGASVNILDGNWQHTFAGTGRGFRTPRDQALCELTIRQQGAFVVEDASTDPRSAHLSLPPGAEMRFYAGHPLESPDGMPVGALCLHDPNPRSFGPGDAALLREFALQVQSTLWQRAEA